MTHLNSLSKDSNKKIKLGILASGSGTNAENLAKYFQNHPSIDIEICCTNKAEAGVIRRMQALSIPTIVFDKSLWKENYRFLELCKKFDLDGLILAGFLWLLPNDLIQAFPKQIINIHPALLPKYGGKGMYGMNVHHAVLENNDVETGITIHLVNENYDEGKILFQAKTNIINVSSAEEIAARIHQLEYKHFPRVVEDYFMKLSI